MKICHKTFAAVAAAALLSACAGTTAPMPSQPVTNQLQAYYWDLQSTQTPQGAASSGWQLPKRPALRLQFSADRVMLQNLCNLANASYQYSSKSTTVQHPVATLRACAEPGLMELERRVLAQLPNTKQLHYSDSAQGPRLSVEFADGSRWHFTGQPTPQTRYGSAPERVFLEVAAQRVACNHPLIPNASCLQVREVRYADNGVKQSSGQWEAFFGDIEGYTHQPGVRNILRLERYKISKPMADGPSIAYVLDMVVETEQVRK